MIKLLCVSVLTMNGALLHFKSFPILQDHAPLSRLDAVFLSITGCVSTGHWMLAVLIGIADLIKRFAFETILAAYICFVVLLFLNAICIIKLLSARIAVLRKNNLPAVHQKIDRAVVKYYRFRVTPGLESFAQVRRNTKKLRHKKWDGA